MTQMTQKKRYEGGSVERMKDECQIGAIGGPRRVVPCQA